MLDQSVDDKKTRLLQQPSISPQDKMFLKVKQWSWDEVRQGKGRDGVKLTPITATTGQVSLNVSPLTVNA